MTSRSIPCCWLVAVCAALVCATAQATLLEVESFDYPANTGQGLNTLSGGTGWGANAWTDTDALPTLAGTNTSLAYPASSGLLSSGGRLELTLDAVNNPATRTLGTSMSLAVANGVYYSSALFRRSALTGELTSVLFDDGTNLRWYYGIDDTGKLSVAVDPSNGAQRTTSASTVVVDTTYLVVARFRNNTGSGGTDEVFLKAFPEGSTVAEPATDADWDLKATGSSSVVLTRVRVAMSNTAGQTNQFDELRVGTTFADVAGIPEPGTAALLALGSLALVRRRR